MNNFVEMMEHTPIGKSRLMIDITYAQVKSHVSQLKKHGIKVRMEKIKSGILLHRIDHPTIPTT